MYPHLIEDKHIQAARNILKELEVDFMFKIMSDNMSEFEVVLQVFLQVIRLVNNIMEYVLIFHNMQLRKHLRKQSQISQRLVNILQLHDLMVRYS